MYRTHSIILFSALVSVCYSYPSEPTSRIPLSPVPSGTTADYIIFAKEDTNKADGDGFGNTLAGLVGIDEVETIVGDAGIPVVWRARLNANQLAKVKADPIVAEANINDPFTLDDPEPVGTQPPVTQRKRAEVTQAPIAKNDLFDLRTLSTPPRVKGSLPNYRYDEFAGEGITVYVVDTGPFDLGHDEFSSPGAGITRSQLNVAREKKFDLEYIQHGTCAASKTVGKMTGVAKRANLVGVRINLNQFGLLRGLQAVVDDVKQKGHKGKAVVTTSVYLKESNTMYTVSMRSVIKSLVNLDVPIVATAGNRYQEGITEPNTLPATLAKELPVIVVGAAAKDFKIAAFSQRGDLVTTYAIGVDVQCADLAGIAERSGTSFAAPQVAGMVAYWMSHPEFAGDLRAGSVAKTLRDMVGALSYPRVAEAGYPPIAWNGHDLPHQTKQRN
ncbi:allergen Pen n 13 [Colletotrichum tabaci]|uniref:Allergen Pen n 13 n=1 Tax=Colletotrichum tabaci TaxID=1209068 RepID=A0AAV9T0S8_9PEZI